MCKGICKTGYQCEREHWLDANGLCRDHKDQYYIQQRAREHDRFLKRHLERERAFEECTRGPKRIRLSDPLSFHVLPLAFHLFMYPRLTSVNFCRLLLQWRLPHLRKRSLLQMFLNHFQHGFRLLLLYHSVLLHFHGFRLLLNHFQHGFHLASRHLNNPSPLFQRDLKNSASILQMLKNFSSP